MNPPDVSPEALERLICNYTDIDRAAVRRFLGTAEMCGYSLSRAALSREKTEGEAAMKATSDLIECAAILARGTYTVTEYQEDYSVKVPQSVLHQIGKQNERLVSLSQRIKRNIDTIRAALAKQPAAELERFWDGEGYAYRDAKQPADVGGGAPCKAHAGWSCTGQGCGLCAATPAPETSRGEAVDVLAWKKKLCKRHGVAGCMDCNSPAIM